MVTHEREKLFDIPVVLGKDTACQPMHEDTHVHPILYPTAILGSALILDEVYEFYRVLGHGERM